MLVPGPPRGNYNVTVTEDSVENPHSVWAGFEAAVASGYEEITWMT